MKAGLLFLSCLVLTVVAADLVALSDRNYVPDGWTRGKRSDPHANMVIRIFLTQQNVDVLEDVLMAVSDPNSPEYGKYLEIDEILDIVSPPEEDADKVIAWLVAGGIAAADIQNFRDSLKVAGTVNQIENLFNTQLFEYSRNVMGKAPKVVSRQWGTSSIPSDVRPLIQIITGLDTFPAFKRKPLPTRPAEFGVGASVGYVIPDTIRRVYNVPATVTTNPKSSVGLIEFQDDNSYNKADLTYFEKEMGVVSTKVTHVVGPYHGETPDAEASLDVQYATAIADGTDVWYWTTPGWLLDFTQNFFNAKDVPLVISMSWGWTTSDQCQIVNCGSMTNEEYVSRTNTEWAKIGVRGVSMFAASGDQGAPGDGNAYCSNAAAPLSSIFPGDSPHITSVGATMLVADGSKATNDTAAPPICNTYHCATSNKEAVCTYPVALITTGGGFAYYSPRPKWQETQVEAYLKTAKLPPTKFFHEKNRGFPDIAGLGHNYLIRLGGSWQIVDGTSCSTPVWAGMVALINDARLNAGKAAVGFIAPMLYDIFAKDPSVFNSLPTGNNKCTESCCSQYGYEAGPQWDPATGLGTPDFKKLMTHAMSY
eukprot:TRINITY_DN14062_c0_g1_i1.p1 TRINITY_DN14062_c0_g1~~TRINITY_DN14062_c0_g1_i1.p1  ORF type:complete len:593 (-),score=124.65 TRINITY_DN14062_c0_g1_i1:31-1809(-)